MRVPDAIQKPANQLLATSFSHDLGCFFCGTLHSGKPRFVDAAGFRKSITRHDVQGAVPRMRSAFQGGSSQMRCAGASAAKTQ